MHQPMMDLLLLFFCLFFLNCFIDLLVIFVMGAAASDGLGMLAGREIEAMMLLCVVFFGVLVFFFF